MATLKQLQEVFVDVFDDDEIELYNEMTADDYEDWDSLSHIQLVVAVEKAFDVKFTTVEVANMKNVGEFVSLLDSKKS
jgi:acyl carrier protein